MSINVSLSYDSGFSRIYNRFNTTETGVKLLSIEGISPDKFDRRLQSKNYHKSNNAADITVDSNANATRGKSPNNYRGEISKAYDKLDGYYLLWKFGCNMYDENTATDLIEGIINGDLYFHDSTQVDIPYCFCASFSHLMVEGRPWAEPVGLPPKKLKSFISQCAETIIDMSSEQAGALALGDIIACMVYYVRNENTSDYEIRDAFQSLVHIVNNKFRLSGQSPFTNVSIFDEPCYHQLFDEMIYPDGTGPTWEEFNRLQKIYTEWYSHGDPKTNLPYSFPVTTLNSYLENGKPADKESFKWYTKINLEKATFNFYLTSETGKLASCCRLVNDLNLMAGINTAFGNGGLNIGSARVVTINLPRIAIKVHNKYPSYDNGEFTAEYIKELDIQLERVKKLLLIQREILKQRIDEGYLKFFKYGYIDLDLHLFSTIGYVGTYDALEVLGKDPIAEEGIKITGSILSHIKDATMSWSKETGVAFNSEQIPAESAAYKFAQKDAVLYGTDKKIYSNQVVPLTRKSNVLERLKIAGYFEKLATGGAIVHINVGEELKSEKQMESLCMAAVKSGINQFAVNYDYCICQQDSDHVSKGTPKTEYCPVCGGKIGDHLTRIIGYWAPVSGWAEPRKLEHKDRDYNQIVKI